MSRETLMPFLALIACSLACGSSTSGPGPDLPVGPVDLAPARLTAAIDYDNAGDASDVAFRLLASATPAGVREYRVFVQRETETVPGLATVSGFGADRVLVIPGGSTSGLMRLPATLNDAGGAAIREGVPYRLGVATIAADQSAIGAVTMFGTTLTLARTDLVRTLASSLPIGTGGVEVDRDGAILVADFGPTLSGGGDRVLRVMPDGTTSVFATGLSGASGNTLNRAGDLIQSSITAGRLDRITAGGEVTTLATGLAGPVGVVFGDADTLYVANCGDHSIRKVSPEGAVETMAFGPPMACPNGITRADDGNLYISNFNNGNVVRLTSDGQASVLATLPGGNNGHVLWGNGRLYVVARGAHQIYEVGLDGSTRLIAGTGLRGGDDGPALEATLSLTNDIAFSLSGDTLFFNDVARSSGATNLIAPSSIRALILARTDGSQASGVSSLRNAPAGGPPRSPHPR